ncbi:uncharacterized protein LOC134189044 [Corticium candelabrum]|uniref:uncharacterized protein LOC134189044 n=1 Tax=Corticium candelabrum TaxID=121492 RepID=UPI002E27465E|nr:uncharacterized protein LOC134189044 [Corticium candelabrum]
MDCGLSCPGVVAFLAITILGWPHLIRAEVDEGNSSLKQANSTSTLLSKSCLAQCAGVGAMQATVCETDLCSEDVSIPLVYPDGMFCVQGGHTVSRQDVTTTYCNVIPYKAPNGLMWNITVSNGSLCKAICFNTKALLYEPAYFNVGRYLFRSTDHDRVLHLRDNATYCALLTSKLDVLKDDTNSSVKRSGECSMGYAVSNTDSRMILVSATANPPDEAVASCGVACIETSSSTRFNDIQKFSKHGQIVTTEDCLYCYLNDWKGTLPSSNVPAGCVLTRDMNNYWNLTVDGGSDVSCSVECFCYKPPNTDNIHSGVSTMSGLTGYLLGCLWIIFSF